MKQFGIKYLLRFTTVIPLLLVAFLFALLYNGQFNKELNQHLSRLGESYIHQLLPAAQFAMMRHDHRGLQGLIDASAINREVRSIVFYDAEGQLIAYRGGKHPIKKPFKPPQYTGDYIKSKLIQPYAINFLAPVTMPKFDLYSTNRLKQVIATQPNDILGWLSLDIDTQSLLLKRYQMYIITTYITLLGLLIGLSIHHFLSKQIYLPISRLRRSMKQILSNEFETQIQVKSLGELGLIEKGCAHLQKQYMHTVRDINQHIEVATKDLQESLEFLEEKNIELTLEKKKYEEKNRQKSEFIANMSHEIRNPMTGLIGFTNLLLESKLDNVQLDYVKTIQSSAQSLLAVINDILDYSKIDSGKLHLDSIPVDIRHCMDEVVSLAAPLAHKKGLQLIPLIETHVPHHVLGDPFRIKQIITNLVNNAIKFTDKGHVLIRVSLERETDKNYTFCLSITDTGIGIPLEDQPKLFSAFNQADTSITRRFGGSGLGLVICKKLAEQMQGRIVLTSQPDKGSTFSVFLVLDKMAAFELEKKQPQPFTHLKAICFDEHPLCLEALCNHLRFLGIYCIPVTTFKQLSNVMSQQLECHLAFININEGSEDQVAEILNKNKLPSVIISNRIPYDEKSFGAKAILFKPITHQKLYETIELTLHEPLFGLNKQQGLGALRAELKTVHPRILLAEDNPANQLLMATLLKDHCKLDIVDNGEEAVRASNFTLYNLILLDLQMPKLDGLNAAYLIHHESSLNQQTPMIVISADTSYLNKTKLSKAGVTSCLEKPIDEKQLLTSLLHAVKRIQFSLIDWDLCVKKVSGNELLAKDFLTCFIDELRKNRREFIGLMDTQNISGLGDLAHKVQGACSFCGVVSLQNIVTRLERQTKSAKQAIELKSAFDELIQTIDDVINEFDRSYRFSN